MKPALEDFLTHLDALVAHYRDVQGLADLGRERSIQYGNVRYEHFEGEPVARVGVIYETPPGSTNQIMVEYSHQTGTFRVPQVHLPEEIELTGGEEVLRLVGDHIEAIPEKRWERLRSYIDSWLEQGRPRLDMWAELAEMCKQQMKGGRITHDELSRAARYIVERTRDSADCAR